LPLEGNLGRILRSPSRQSALRHHWAPERLLEKAGIYQNGQP